MSVTAKIMQRSLFKKKLDVDDIIKISGLACGVCDSDYRLIANEKGEHTLLYDTEHLARGIDLWFENNDILLSLSLPTAKEEIRAFYNTIEKICNVLKTNTYVREEEKVRLSQNESFIKADEQGALCGLEQIRENIKEKYSHFQIFGIKNPISLGEKEINEIDNDLNKFGKFLHEKQNIDAFYNAPRVYKKEDKIFGVYAVVQDCKSILPTKPYVTLNQIDNIDEWYVFFDNNKTISYSDFISNIDNAKYYDFNHIIVNLSSDEIEALTTKYFEEP